MRLNQFQPSKKQSFHGTSSLNSEDMRPQRQPKESQIGTMPHLSLGLTTERKTHRSSSQPSITNLQTKRSDIESGSTTNRIQLPKLSFNDLIQAQKYDSFQILQNQSKPSKLILVDEPVIKQIKPSQSSEEFWRFPKLQLVSKENSSGAHSIVRSRERSARSQESQSSYHLYNMEKQKKQNVIDSEGKLSLAFRTRKLLLKAWKSFLITKMNAIHTDHAEKLSNAYLTRKLLFKYLQVIKLYTKRIAPEERQMKAATDHYNQSLTRLAFDGVRRVTGLKRWLRNKYQSAMAVLDRQRTRRALAYLKVGVAQSQIQNLRVYQAEQQLQYRLRLKTLKSFALYTVASKRYKQTIKQQINFRELSLKRRSVEGLKEFMLYKRAKVMKQMTAKSHYQNNFLVFLKHQIYHVLFQYSKYRRQEKKAQRFRGQWLMFRHLKSLKLNMMLRRGEKMQNGVVKQFRTQLWQVKIIKALRLMVQQTRDHAFIVQMYLDRGKARKAWRALLRYKNDRHIPSPPMSGPFLRCCEIMLRASFGEMMDTVWKEFPKQRLHLNLSTGHEHHLLNYLGLSQNPRYRHFFYLANIVLRKYLMRKCFDQLRRTGNLVRAFRRRLQTKETRLAFEALRKQAEKQILLRYVLSQRNAIRDKQSLSVAIYAFKKNRSLSRAFYRQLLAQKQSLLSRCLTHWVGRVNRLAQAQVDDRASMQIYRQRFLTKYLSLWLKKLHVSLKKKHLNKLKVGFERKSGLRKQYFYDWVNQLRIVRYLKDQEKSINVHKNGLLIYNCFCALRNNMGAKKEDKRKSAAARQERRYWLAKQAFVNLKEGVVISQQKSHLVQVVWQDYHATLKTRVFACLKNYHQYRIDKKVQDYLMTRAVQDLERRRFLNQWRRQLQSHVGLKLIAYTFQRAQVRVVLSKMAEVVSTQDQAVSIAMSRRDHYRKLSLFSLLKGHWLKKRSLKAKLEVVQKDNVKRQRRVSFVEWHRLFRSNRKLYITYAFIVIQLKNHLIRPFLDALRRNVRHQKEKRVALLTQRKATLSKTLQALRVFSLERKRLIAVHTYLSQHGIRNQLVKTFAKWSERYETNILVKQKQAQASKAIAFKVFTHLNAHRKARKQARADFLAKKEALLSTKKKLGLIRFLHLASLRIQQRGKYDVASNFNQQYMFRSSLKAWVNFYKLNQPLISKQVSIERSRRASTKQLFLGRWLDRSARTLQLLKAAKRVIVIRNRKAMKPRFQVWVDQTNFLISLEQRTLDYLKRQQRKDKKSALQTFREHLRQESLNRARNQNVKMYHDKKVQYSCLIALNTYMRHRKLVKSMKQQAYSFLGFKLKLHGLKGMQAVTSQSLKLKESTYLLNRYQKQTLGSHALLKLRQNRSLARQYEVLKRFACEYHAQQLFSKSLQGLFVNIKSRQHERRQIAVAYEMRSKQLALRGFRALAIWASYHSTLILKREVLNQVIRKVDLMQRLKSAFDALHFFKIKSMQHTQDATSMFEMKKTRRLFHGMAYLSKVKHSAKQAYASLTQLRTRKAQARFYGTWRRLFLNERIVRDQAIVREMNLKAVALDVLKRGRLLVQIQSMLRQKAAFNLKLKAFGGFVAYLQHRKSRAIALTTAHLDYLKRLGLSFFKAFALKRSKGQLNERASVALRVNLKKKVLLAIRASQERSLNSLIVLRKRNSISLRQALIGWSGLAQKSHDRKDRLRTLIASKEVSSVAETFKKWRQIAFFENFCMTVHKHCFADHEQYLKQAVLREWVRYAVFKRHKQYYRECIEAKHRGRVQRTVTAQWKDQCKFRLLAIKLQHIVNSKMSNAFDVLKSQNQKISQLEARGSRLSLKVLKQRKADFFMMWVLAKVQARRNRLVTDSRTRSLSHKGLRALSIHRLEKLEEKYQMLKVIQFFSERRAEVLLAFSRLFLIQSNKHCKHYLQGKAVTRVCSTTLIKYALEQWKNNREKLRISNFKHQQAQRFYLSNLFRKGLRGLREGVSVLCHKRSLKLSCYEFYHVSIMKKVLFTLSNNSMKGRRKQELNDMMGHMIEIRSQQMLHTQFHTWIYLQRRNQRLRAFEWEVQARYNRETIFKAYQALKQHTIKSQTFGMRYEQAIYGITKKIKQRYFKRMLQSFIAVQEDRLGLEIKAVSADQFYETNLQRRVLKLLRGATKELKHKAKYSRIYTVFVAWKFFVKEKKLLDKYLSECNYQQQKTQRSSSQRSRVRGSLKNAGTRQEQPRRALVDLDIQAHGYRQLPQVEGPLSQKNQTMLGQTACFTPTLGQASSFQQLHMSADGTKNENINSMNSPHDNQSPQYQDHSSSSSHLMAQRPRANPRYQEAEENMY